MLKNRPFTVTLNRLVGRWVSSDSYDMGHLVNDKKLVSTTKYGNFFLEKCEKKWK
jgi:hypothetical protein